MGKIDLIMPKMGESIMEATILKWLKKEGDPVEQDESILEIATDKVDSEVPAPEAGIMGKILFSEDETITVGTVIAYLHTEGESSSVDSGAAEPAKVEPAVVEAVVKKVMEPLQQSATIAPAPAATNSITTDKQSGRFYSPLVMNIARTEGISMDQLETIPGTGKDGRVSKKDILSYLKNGSPAVAQPKTIAQPENVQKTLVSPSNNVAGSAYNGQASVSGNVEIVEMDRMRKLIADHMVMSKQDSPHVTSFVEADVTNLVNWRNKIKGDFKKREGQNITFTPIFVEAVTNAIKEFPGVNASIDGYNVILKKDINIGIATALPSGNLIVPVIKGADNLNLTGITKAVNGLVNKARNNKLAPADVQDGTFTVTNVGTFGNLSGTPIINQPQVAILATGAIKKKPAVL